MPIHIVMEDGWYGVIAMLAMFRDSNFLLDTVVMEASVHSLSRDLVLFLCPLWG